MDKIEIRKVELTDIEELLSVSIRTFYETFAGGNTEEDMKKYLDENLNHDKLTHELMVPGSVFYFASIRNNVIGYLKLNSGKAQTELKGQKTIEIERIFILREYQGKGVGQILFDFALKIATDLKMDFIWLGVWGKNHQAIKFYRKNGFEEFGKHGFLLGNDQQTDLMMKLKIN